MRKNIFPVLILICGIILIGFLVSNMMEVNKIKKYGITVQAEWTGEIHDTGVTTVGFRFKTKSGETVSVSLPPPVTVEQLRNGESISIRYLETDPRKTARIAGHESGKTYILWIAGVLMLLYGIYGNRSSR